MKNNPKVTLGESFWEMMQSNVIEKVIPYEWEALNDRVEGAPPSFCIHNFQLAAGRKQGSRGGFVFQDSDLAKFIEAAAWSLMVRPDPEREREIDDLIGMIDESQEESGYLNTAFTLERQDQRFQNLRDWHELYVAGHFVEAAVAYWRVTGKDRLVRVMEKNIRHIRQVVGPEEDHIHGYPGHEELELALVKLYEATGKKEYLDFAKYLVDERGKKPNFFEEEHKKYGHGRELSWDASLLQAHQPVREQQVAVGHAVRAGYLYSGMADVARLTGDETLEAACERLFDDIAKRQMYITGGVGQTPEGEAFTFDYHLPNDTVYAESCAAIALVLFAHRMLKMTPDRRYADVMERTLYNGVLSGISLDGTKFFYENPLEVWPEACDHHVFKGIRDRTRRQPWFGCACCPPNIARMLLSVQEYVCTTLDNTLYFHLYTGGTIEQNGFKVTMQTDYPWDGRIGIKVETGGQRTLAFRLPGWCTTPSVKINGSTVDTNTAERGYLSVERMWVAGDSIELDFPMDPVFMVAHPAVRADSGRVALVCGPLVYCMEEEDNGPDLHRVLVDPGKPVTVCKAPGLPCEIKALSAHGFREKNLNNELYSPFVPPETEPVTLCFVPYYTWANRGRGEMMVWIRRL